MSTSPSSRRERAGFALLITITLVAFLVLILLSLAAVTRVETRVADNSQRLEQARRNALLGLDVAIGELQRTAGPDQRVSAGADMGLTVIHDGTRHWTGMWGNRSPASYAHGEPTFLNWLVSGNEDVTVDMSVSPTEFGRITSPIPSPAFTPGMTVPGVSSATKATDRLSAGGTDWSLLVGPGTVDDPADYVLAPMVPVSLPAGQLPGAVATNNTEVQVGGYAFWVGDEGTKTRVNAVEAESLISSSEDETRRLRYRRPGLTGLAQLVGAPETLASLADNTGAGMAVRDRLRRVIDESQLAVFSGSGAASFIRGHFHSLTMYGHGVLANVLTGGLRRDLTAGFAPGTGPADEPSGPIWTATEEGPRWQLLRSYYQLPDSPGAAESGNALMMPPRGQTDSGQHGLCPVVARWQIALEARLQPNPGGGGGAQVALRIYPAIVLWNPYNVTIKDTGYVVSYMLNDGGGRVFARLSKGTDSTSGLLPPVPTGSYAQVNSHWFLNTGKPLLMRVRSGDMPPGQAFVYTLEADVVHGSGSVAAAADPDNHVLTRGWHVGGGFKAIEQRSNLFPMPVLAAPEKYFMSLYVDRGGSAVTFPGSAGTAAWPSASASLQNDRLTLLNADGVEVLQDVRQITSWLDPTATGLLLQQADVPAVATTYGYLAQKWALKTTAKGVLKNINDGFVNTGIGWLSHYNPRAPILSRSPYDSQAVPKYFNSNPNFNLQTTDRYAPGDTLSADKLTMDISDPDTGRAFVGMSQNVWDGLGDPEVPLFDVPRGRIRMLSLGALQHANVLRVGTDQGANYTPAYAIGNALADPRVGLDRVRRDLPLGSATWGKVVHDDSYLLNRALWDGYFFSTVPAGSGAVSFPLGNPRLERFAGVAGSHGDADLRTTERAAAGLWTVGAFNINSTSTEAWRALLGGFVSIPVGATERAGESPYPRLSLPLDDDAVLNVATGASLKAGAYRGYRFLTAGEIGALADEIVRQVRMRGPFASLADFVNRALVDTAPAGGADTRLRGALAQAIGDAGINTAFSDGPDAKLPAARTGGTDMPNDAEARIIHDGKTAEDVPGWLSQADLLQSLGPALSARSDIFRIRACGQSVNPTTGATDGRVWCEAIVQRTPDYIDENDATLTAGAATSPWLVNADNQRFGRRFRVVSFRWLSASDI